MTPDDYLTIYCVSLPLAVMAIFAVVIAMKQGWIKKKGEG